MKKINIQDFETRSPKSNQAFFDNLKEEAKENYLLLYLTYSNLLYCYLLNKLKLKEFDNMLVNGRNHFQEVSIDNMDFYQYLAKDYLKYFYIRNNLYIERLNENELNFLKKKNFDNNLDLDEETINFISKTYPKVIKENNDSKSVNINYGPDNFQFYKPSDALIIGVRFDDYYKEPGETSEEWDSKYNDKLYELDVVKFCLSTNCYVFLLIVI